jgi:hypothetical protein
LIKIYENREDKPLIFAFSGFVNDDIKKKAIDAGFTDIIEAPLCSENINQVIISRL